MDLNQFESRKKDHIDQSLRTENQAIGMSGLDSFALVHEALPDLNFEDVTIQTTRMGQSVLSPFFICGMTAGHPGANQINQVIARVCEEKGWAMGVGSQRRELNLDDGVDRWSQFKSDYPKLEVYGNIGIAQLIQSPIDQIQALVDRLEPNGIFIHLNALQEVIQPEGTPQFKGGLQAIETAVNKLSCSVLIKETGCGFSQATLERLKQTGVKAVDVSGKGGTHWGRIEGARAEEKSHHALASETFANWGVSTVESVRNAILAKANWEIWASGGIRSGLDASKLFALGADQVGFAQPALKAALEGEEALRQWMGKIEFELKTALFCTGCDNLDDLRGKRGSCPKIVTC